MATAGETKLAEPMQSNDKGGAESAESLHDGEKKIKKKDCGK